MATKHNTLRRMPNLPRRQRGVALIVALIILIGVTLISLAGVGQSTMELRMARNLNASVDTFQTAESVIDVIVQNADTALPTTGPLLGPSNVTGTLPATTVFATTGGETITANAVRLLDCAPPPRARAGSSITAFSAFAYEIVADVDRNATGNGRTGLAQGYLVLGPKC